MRASEPGALLPLVHEPGTAGGHELLVLDGVAIDLGQPTRTPVERAEHGLDRGREHLVGEGVVHEDVGHVVGDLGPQALTITDGATREVQAMWDRLGGSTGGITCLGWTRVFRPARFAAQMAQRRRGTALGTPRPAGGLPTSRDELTPELLIELLGRTRARLRPA